ncbi:MAG: dephospho-CoA kinase [Lachnospiraceae bacterium]|nr:dephospho-CoA kinase [Lachnospiraceae bacterium]
MTERTGTRRSKGREENQRAMHSEQNEKIAKVLGITGGVGAGKSTILSYLREQYGACILEADKVGHQVQQPGEACWEQIKEKFGAEILKENGTIDRERLGAVVYADRDKMEQLNAIVHPAVKTRILEEIDVFRSRLSVSSEKALVSECKTQKFPVLVIEAALLLEDHYDAFCDEVWYVYADEETRTRRLMKSRGYSREKIRQIMHNQLSEEEFRRRCQAVIDNSGEDMAHICAQIDERIKCFLEEKDN